MTTVEILKSYCMPFSLYGFDAVTLFDANAPENLSVQHFVLTCFYHLLTL